MRSTVQPLILTSNSFQNLCSSQPSRANMIGNLSLVNPTVQQMNDAISNGANTSPSRGGEEPAFGVHVREAADVFRRMIR